MGVRVERAVREDGRVTRIAIVGGGPGGYEAALVAAQLGGEVTVVDRDGLGGSAVLTDCVPSKTLIATAEVMTIAADSGQLGVRLGGEPPVGVDTSVEGPSDTGGQVSVNLSRVNDRVKRLAHAQSDDVRRRLEGDGVRIVRGVGRLDGPSRVVAELDGGGTETVQADAVLLATGAHPRELPRAVPDGERILTWTQLYDLGELPERLVVVGSGVTGAEFASAYTALGSDVTLVSSRDRVLPGEDADAAQVLEDVFGRRGMTVMGRSRAKSVQRSGDGVVVRLEDGRCIEATHCLLAVGSVPNTDGIGLEEAGVRREGGFVDVDRVSRTTASGVYAAGDCTGVMMLASVAAMQGRIAMWHALGDAVAPLDLRTVSSNVFTDPEIATVGWSQAAVEAGEIDARTVKLPLATNARAKMQGLRDGFVKLFCRTGTGIVVGGVVVAPRASELIFPVALAVELGLTVDQVAHAFSIYPSLTGSITEAARQLHPHRG
jgi:pyruvate/2-oxoglutarate dehydrogenase complex dihydrolipoamide dehydrogenase (E3) component